MHVKKMIEVLKEFDGDAIVTCGDEVGWSNVDYIRRDGSCVKIIMDDNVVFSDDKVKNQDAPGEESDQHTSTNTRMV